MAGGLPAPTCNPLQEPAMNRIRLSAWTSLLMAVVAAALAAGGGEGGQDPIHFKDATKSAGLLEPLVGMMGHGGAWGDFDGDGLIDLYVGGFCDRPNSEYAPAKGPVPN